MFTHYIEIPRHSWNEKKLYKGLQYIRVRFGDVPWIFDFIWTGNESSRRH